MPDGTTTSENSAFRQLWRENHGNFLLAFAGGILAIGAIVMIWPEPEPRLLIPEGGPYNYQPMPHTDDTVDRSISPEEGGDAEANFSDTSLLLIHVSGLQSKQGKIRIAIYSDPLSYDQQTSPAFKNVVSASSGAEWKLEVPAHKPIAISVFHDENENETLDRNLLGIPSERYGFSRGARSQSGPPPFAEAAFVPEPGIVDVPIEIW